MTETAEGFTKHYASAALADVALYRTGLALAAGVPTPAVLGRAGGTTLIFQHVAVAAPPDLPQMSGVLQCLHGLAPAGFARFDPFRRIRPRLGLAPAQVSALVTRLQAQDAARHRAGRGVIHGDFHPGQVLCDVMGKVWLVDLDDMALAPREADFGNLAAWMATQAEGPLDELAQTALARVLAVAPDADPDLARHFCRIALVRRALKLAGKGQPWALRQLSLRA